MSCARAPACMDEEDTFDKGGVAEDAGALEHGPEVPDAAEDFRRDVAWRDDCDLQAFHCAIAKAERGENSTHPAPERKCVHAEQSFLVCTEVVPQNLLES